ncbi:MAG: S8 family serine peptidase, partial [Clostridiales bacterium]|nr:S8 family serine peptidase [Clostridiales bacterium]
MVGSNCYLFFDPSVGNFLIEYRGPFIEEIARVDYACGVAINETFGVIAVSENDIDRLRRDVPSIVFIDIRTMLVLQEISPSFVDNINNIKLNPYLDLTGRGVIVGIIDTGINYLNPEFIREDGTSRIISLWDQNIRSDEFQDDYNMYIGKVFTNEQINSAIQANRNNQDPFTIVPSRDEVGHGTKVAGIIGARGENPDLEGVANRCDFVIVKLFQSTNFQRLIRENNMDPPPVYNMSELFTALEFLRNEFLRLKRPMV